MCYVSVTLQNGILTATGTSHVLPVSFSPDTQLGPCELQSLVNDVAAAVAAYLLGKLQERGI